MATKYTYDNQSGYTLIELLTVVTVIGILITIAIPHYVGYRDKAQMTTIYAAIHQIQISQEVYKTHNQIYYSFGDTVLTHDDSPVGVDDTDLEIYIPKGQKYQIQTTTDFEADYFTVSIQANFDRNTDGINDLYIFKSDETTIPLYPTTF
nr:prepilin-type N-terminal cleavage/methylation domain-containing protein [uncultured Desulfuromonas sp.]